MHDTETIAAVATPPGQGGVGIVRLSGPAVPAIGEAILGRLPAPRYAAHRLFRDAQGNGLDDGLALFFEAPASFTGEHVLELHGHGGPVVMDLVLQRVLALGARPARAGEFSERAFLNGKLDLAQAEAVADLVEAGTARAAQAATRSLHGAFSRRVHGLTEDLIALRTYVEAAIDFPDEDVDFLADGQVAERTRALLTTLDAVTAEAGQGRLLREGMTVVIAGRPNAGKSSLLNQLAGRDSAIVTDVPGTTRDVLREAVQIDGLPLHVIDTAGLRDSPDRVEAEGVRRAWAQIEAADRLLLIVDDTVGESAEDQRLLDQLPAAIPRTVVRNKIDLSGTEPGWDGAASQPTLRLSALTGTGLALLREHLKAAMGYHSSEAGHFMARRRHLEALDRARHHLVEGYAQIAERRAGELLAEELRGAQQALGEITGEFTNEELLGRIFSSFCIGK